MSSISSYLTINNVAYASTAVSLIVGYGIDKLEKGPTKKLLNDWYPECFAVLSFAGIAAVVIKERSFQSTKLATLFIVGMFAVGCWKQDGVFKKKVENGSVGATVGMWGYAVVSLIIAAGTKIAPYLRKH